MLSDSVCYQHLILPLADKQHNRAPKGNFLNKIFFKSRFDILEYYGNDQHQPSADQVVCKTIWNQCRCWPAASVDQNIVFPEDFHPLLIGLLDHFCKLRHLLVLVLTDKDQKRCWVQFNRLRDHKIFFELNQSLWGAGALVYHLPGTWGQSVFVYL